MDHPSNIGDDYIVYVDDINNPSKPVGYRSGYTWYMLKVSKLLTQHY